MRQTQNTKKDNRKSIFVIALLLLLVAVIGFGGYTMSKYISSKTENGTASVAKWGFTVDANAEKLFGKNYKFDTNKSVVAGDEANLTVKASDESNRVAPGTSGSMTFGVEGKAEVLAAVKIEFTATKDVALKYSNNGVAEETPYAPVKWTLKKGDQVLVENKKLAEVQEELAKVEETRIEAGTEVKDTYELSWAWAFASGNDELDTLLGMYANNTDNTTNGNYAVVADGTETGIEFTLKISVVQLEK